MNNHIDDGKALLAENAKLKQERDELAAMVAVLQDVCGFVITGPAALNEIRAQVLDDGANWLEKNRSKWLGDLPEAALRKLAAAERAKGEK